MYVVVATGGKQCVFQTGQKYWIEKVDHEVDAQFELDQVLFLKTEDATLVGQPTLPDVKVIAKVVAQGRDKKINIIKFKRRKHHMKRAGHRQDKTQILIESIETKRGK